MGGSRAISPLSSLCATTLATTAASTKSPRFSHRASPAHHLSLCLAAAMSSSSSPSPAPATVGGDFAAPAPFASSAIDFLTLCYRLKTTKRVGWVRRGVQGPESVADHMYCMGIMALVVANLPSIDRDRCVKMVIVHDIAKAIVGGGAVTASTEGKYYLVDVDYPNRPGCLAPYKGQRYHVPKFRRGVAPSGEKEKFNQLYSSGRNLI